MSDELFVKSVYPQAKCTDKPVRLYWPGQGERLRYIVTASPVSSRSEGEGATPEEAWAKAAERVRHEAVPAAPPPQGEGLPKFIAAEYSGWFLEVEYEAEPKGAVGKRIVMAVENKQAAEQAASACNRATERLRQQLAEAQRGLQAARGLVGRICEKYGMSVIGRETAIEFSRDMDELAAALGKG